MTGSVAIDTVARWRATGHLGLGVALDTRQFDVFACQFQFGELAVLLTPVGQTHPLVHLADGMAEIALLAKLGLGEFMNTLVATLAVIRQPQVSDTSGFQSLVVTGGTGHLGVVFGQHEAGQIVFEGLLSADVFPIDDVGCSPLVTGVAADALVGEGGVQALLLGDAFAQGFMAVQALGVGDTLIGFVALATTVRVVELGMAFAERSGRDPKKIRLGQRPGRDQEQPEADEHGIGFW